MRIVFSFLPSLFEKKVDPKDSFRRDAGEHTTNSSLQMMANNLHCR